MERLLEWSEKLSNERDLLINMINNASRDGGENILDRLHQFELVVAEVSQIWALSYPPDLKILVGTF